MAGDKEDQPGSTTLGYLAPICVAIFFIFVWILVGTRHRFARNQNGRPMDPEGWPLGYGHMVLTSSEIDSQFPMMTYSSWLDSTQNDNNLRKEVGLDGTDPPDPKSEPQPTSPHPSTLSLNNAGDKEVAQKGNNSGAASVNGDSHSLCAICMEYFDHDDSIRSLTCGHIFHAPCLDPWFTKRQARCPLCKTSYPPEGAGAEGTRVFRPGPSFMPLPPARAVVRSQILPRML